MLNKLLGRGTDTGGVEFWRQPERSGWLMKQGERWMVHQGCLWVGSSAAAHVPMPAASILQASL